MSRSTTVGQMRERFAFDKRATSSDGYGNLLGDWVEQCVVAGRRRALLGSVNDESVMAGRLTGQQSYVISIRSSSVTKQITSDWRARDVRSGTIYNIRTIINADERGQYLDLLVETGVADG